MMERTKRPYRQARAIPVRGERRDRALPRLRAPAAGVVLSLLVLLSPDLTLAPLNAVEPQRSGPLPIDLLHAPRPPRSVQPVDVAPPTHAPATGARASAPPSAATASQFAAAISAARQAGGAYGITFAAVRDGDLLWAGASGRSRAGAVALAADDPLVIGSVTKTFVAAAVLQLVEEGRIRLDDPVRDHLPGIAAVGDRITIGQLLDHTSGLADLFNDTTRRGLEEQPDRAWTASEVLGTLRAPWYQPGEGWAYANTNYFLLGMVVEQVTGTSLAEQLDARFLVPLGLERTRLLTGAPEDAGPLAPAWATIFWGSGAMTASATDLARWGDALYGGEVLTDASRAAMIALNSHDYGLGLQRIEVPGAIGYGHTGLLNTYTTLLLHLPERNVTLALLVNRSHVDLGAMLAAEPNDGPSLLELVGVEPPRLP